MRHFKGYYQAINDISIMVAEWQFIALVVIW